MSNYQPRITKYSDGSAFALIVRVDRDGEENVIHGFSRHFKTVANAERSVAAYMAKHGLSR